MTRCPFFGKCGGCTYDFTDPSYRAAKGARVPDAQNAIWINAGLRRRADFCFSGSEFGLFARGSKNIVPVRHCLNLTDKINNLLPGLAALPWGASGSCLITQCDNGIDICITSDVPYFSSEFKAAVSRLPVICVTWNGRIVYQTDIPRVSFGSVTVDYPAGAFLQPTIAGADALRALVVDAARDCRRVADLFCGLGNFTFALNADGFDVCGAGVKRDLFKNPLTPGMLNTYDCVVMDPPRAGAIAQCQQLIKSDVSRVIYVSCNPATFRRDAEILTRGGYRMTHRVPVDQFVGSSHWELFSVFEK